MAEAAREPSLVIAAVDGSGRVVDGALVPPRSALIIGRHTSCGLRLPHGSVALRQIALLARSVAPFGQNGSGGEGSTSEPISTHVWDLDTEQPFRTEDAGSVSALTADGPVYLSVAEYGMWVLPTSVARTLPDDARQAWEALPVRRFIDRRSQRPPPPRADLLGLGRLPAHCEPRRSSNGPEALWGLTSNVTVCAPPLLLQESTEPEIGWGTLRLKVGASKVRHNVSAERLERGILIGRYDRCGIAIAGLDGLSRVHLLLVRIGDEVWAIDTASRNGSRRRGQRVSSIVLEAEDELLLAGALTVTWTQEIHPEA